MPYDMSLPKGPYTGYHHWQEPDPDAELTRVGPRTPAGEYLRRFWQPVAFTHELTDVPLRLRILGEDLVLFRDGSGQIGLLKLHCSHRGTSLEFGRVSERGLRCCYHGWLYDVDGRVLETPGEPPTSTYKERVWHGAFPTHEYKGLVFAYLGPPEKRPAFPIFDQFELPNVRAVPGRKHVIPCNWVQIKDNCMDPVHLVYLHTKLSGPQFNESHALLPELLWQETPIGLIVTQTRRVGGNVWSRNSELIWPNVNLFGPTWEDGKQPRVYQHSMHIIWTVPIDDTTSMNISFMLVDRDDRDWEYIRHSFGQIADRPYEERQRVPGDYDAHTGQRPIAIHALEHLVGHDRGVILFRNRLRDHIRAVQRGEDPPGLWRTPPPAPIPTYCLDAVLPIPEGATPEAEQAILQEVERKVASRYYLDHPEAIAAELAAAPVPG
jgi:nitrite reductase/ring-hydroxylating ferredoxin subunit